MNHAQLHEAVRSQVFVIIKNFPAWFVGNSSSNIRDLHNIIAESLQESIDELKEDVE